MTIVGKFLCVLAPLLVIACNASPSISDLHFDDRYEYAYLNGDLFDGTIWSSDGKRMLITCENGFVKNIYVYHNNGAVAVNSKAFLELGRFFDESGKEMMIDSFMVKYPLIVEDIAAITDDIVVNR